jgi:integrase/recombinase XerD
VKGAGGSGWRNRDGKVPAGAPKAMPAWSGHVDDLRDAVALHQLVLNADGKSPHTQKQYLYYECLFLDYLQARHQAPQLHCLNPTTVREFLVWYRNQDHQRRTRGGEVAVRAAADILKRLGNVLEDNEVVGDNPLRKLKRPRITRFTRVPFSPTEISAMWGACMRTLHPERDEALFLLLLDTGMRIGEACTLELEKLDLVQHQAIVGAEGKGRHERVVPLGDSSRRDGGRMLRSLRRYLSLRPEPRTLADAPYVFLARDGRRLTAAGGNDIIKRIAAIAHVEDAYPHRIRHTYATWYLTVNVGDEIGLRRMLGHVSKEVLQDYVHLSQAAIAERAGHVSLSETWLQGVAPPLARVANGRPGLTTGQAQSRDRHVSQQPIGGAPQRGQRFY